MYIPEIPCCRQHGILFLVISIMKIGIFGGTFDPIHNGHLYSAQELKKIFGFDKIVFIPTGEPPHKVARLITPSRHRYAMVCAAVNDIEGFEVSDIEINRKSYSYTYDTLIELRKKSKADEDYYLIIGADTLADIVNWHKSEEVFKLCSFVAIKRPGLDNDKFEEALRNVKSAGANVHFIEIPQYDISSTQIRRSLASGEDVAESIPCEVSRYIAANGLYRPGELSYSETVADLKGLISQKRFEHCLRVADECAELAGFYGADVEACRLAGLLHDCAKELTDKQYAWLGITDAEDDYEGQSVLRHAEAGAILARERYGVCDDEILEAIRCHITGKPNMSIISQILFVSDYTEKGRSGAPYNKVRELAAKGLLIEAMLEECDNTLIYNIQRKYVVVCTQTVKTRNWLVSVINNKGGNENDSRRE